MLQIILLACAATIVASDGTGDRALVLARKSISSEFSRPYGGETLGNVLVEGSNFTVTVTLYNVGGQEAFEIEVEDEWEEDKFTLMDGSMRAAFTRLAPGENAEYSFVLSPQFSTKNLYEYKPAMVTYMYGEEDEQIETIATSSRPHTIVPNQGIYDGKTFVLSEEEYKSTTAMYFKEWTVFGLVSFLPVIGPLLFWSSSNIGEVKRA
jgi:hypothetical protein